MRFPLLVAFVLLAIAASARAVPTRTFPITMHMVASGSAERFAAHVARANAVFARANVGFRIDTVVPLPPRHAELVTRDDRDALGTLVQARTIDVFVVSTLMDVDEPGRRRGGVHWRDRGRRGVRYVIIVAEAHDWTLAHELGHYFGNGHSPVPGNLMSYDWTLGDPVFDGAQHRRIHRSATTLARAFRLGQGVTGSPR